MLHVSRSASIIAAPLVLVAVLAWVTPAGARLASNRLASNGTSAQGISATAVAQNPANVHITTGSALGDVNGVAVEAVIVPDAAR